tara:strand:+ start:2265 stop:2531 length:267 start_codon:yes stop_codon:yes gene_type:complete
MVKKADIVTRTQRALTYIGIVDKIIDIKGTKVAIVTWIKPNPNQRTFLPVANLKVLRTKEEAAQRGRKKAVPGLKEGLKTYENTIVRT